VEEILPPLQQASAAQGIEVSTEVVQPSETRTPRKWGAGIGGFFTRLTGFLVATRGEMKKVTWPTREELVKATRMILILSVILGVLIGWMDWLLGKILIDGVAALAR
jgi:preprotein translocase SecE subunit